MKGGFNEEKICPNCRSKAVQYYGKNRQNRQRFWCKQCLKAFIWKETYNKKFREKHWFKLWVKESYSIRQISQLSGYSHSKIKRIKDYWLPLSPREELVCRQFKYLIYDGTYFHKDGCLINLMNSIDQKIISHIYTQKEGFYNVSSWFYGLKEKGLNPEYITMDGERSVIRAMKTIWPNIKIQRCLYHIQREGMRWLRTYPKTQAGRDLRYLLSSICTIKSLLGKDLFIQSFKSWLNKYKSFVASLSNTVIAYKDLKKTITLINSAIPDMFHYLYNQNIHSTTNALESFHSRLKADYRRHRGLTRTHRIQYLSWYCYLNNDKKTNFP